MSVVMQRAAAELASHPQRVLPAHTAQPSAASAAPTWTDEDHITETPILQVAAEHTAAHRESTLTVTGYLCSARVRVKAESDAPALLVAANRRQPTSFHELPRTLLNKATCGAHNSADACLKSRVPRQLQGSVRRSEGRQPARSDNLERGSVVGGFRHVRKQLHVQRRCLTEDVP
jgi:hypothetical protein